MDQIASPFETVTIFGGATLDRVAASAMPPVMGASNPGNVRRVPGGVGFNAATVLARLGLKTRLVTAIGSDPDGQAILAAAVRAGVDVGHVVVSGTAGTAAYHATLDNTGNLIIGIADMKVCDEITPAAVAPATARADGDFWVVDANLPPATLAFLGAEAKDARVPIAALTVSPAKAVRLRPILDSITYLFTNRREAAALLGYNPDEAGLAVTALARELTGTRPTKVVVTNGNEPLAASSKGEVRSYASLRAAVKSVNGAGDSFAAGTIYGLAAGHALSDAIRFGRAAAVLALEAGGIAGAPFSADTLAERLTAGPAQIAS